MTAEEIIALLGLTPHPDEGGYFCETFRSAETIQEAHLPGRYGGRRHFGTAIYYLLSEGTFSALHRLKSDEIFHFYMGDPVEMLQLPPDAPGRVVTLGQDLRSGMRPQVVVPRGVWQGARLAPGGRWALMGCTVKPGFEYIDYEHGRAEPLAEAYPEFAAFIRALCTPGDR